MSARDFVHVGTLLDDLIVGGGLRLLFALLLFELPAMTGHSALAPRFASFFARPLVRGTLIVRRLAALAGNLTLLASFH